MVEELLTIKVTRRQLTLIRVACIQRLARLKVKNGYNEVRDMMMVGGCLHLPTVEEDNLPSR